jgi:hypothetical protein
MNYDQRIDYILNWFRDNILTRFTPPTGTNAKTLANDIVEAVNSNIPSNLTKEQMDNILSSLTKDIVHSARSRTLPVTKDFIASTRNASQRLRESAGAALDSSWSLDLYQLTARRVRAGEAIAEAFLFGRQREELKARTGITDADLEKYIDPTAHKQ